MFTKQDFDVFSIDGFEERMDALKERIRPKLEQLGETFQSELEYNLQTPVYYHVAKHARRTVNPPKDTWVAFSTNKRGYKMQPHFQIGLWGNFVFIYFGAIYECPDKKEIGAFIEKNFDETKKLIPNSFVINADHMKPITHPISSLSDEDHIALLQRLQTVKKAEYLIGTILTKEEAIEMSEQDFIDYCKTSLQTLTNLYLHISKRNLVGNKA